jgi:hypothetical protein
MWRYSMPVFGAQTITLLDHQGRSRSPLRAAGGER